GVTAERFGLDVIPPHRLLARRMRPRTLARQRAGLASDAAVDVEDDRELTFRPLFRIRELHFTAQLPIVDLRHGAPLQSNARDCPQQSEVMVWRFPCPCQGHCRSARRHSPGPWRERPYADLDRTDPEKPS